MAGRITLAEIARQVGVTKATVSMALRGDVRISESTRSRVVAAAKVLGYRPDPMLSNLASLRWSKNPAKIRAAFAYLVDSRHGSLLDQKRFLPSAQARAAEYGFHVDVVDLADYPTIKSAGRVLYSRGIRGLLVPQLDLTGSEICELGVDDFAIVCLDRNRSQMPFHLVLIDHFRATRNVWYEVVKRGYTRIGGALLQHNPPALDDATRLGASYVAEMEWIPPDRRIPILATDLSDREGLLDWVERHRPDAVIGYTIRQYTWLRDAGWKIPEDIAYAAMLNVDNNEVGLSGLSMLTHQTVEVGVSLLVSLVKENECGIPTLRRKILLEPAWVEGTTLPWKKGPTQSLDRPQQFGGCLGAPRYLVPD